MQSTQTTTSDLALVLGGGGARAAYQAGVIRWLAQRDVIDSFLEGRRAG